MKTGNKTFVALSYTLTVGGKTVDQATAEAPLQFVFGAGYLLPKFEENISGLEAGDRFEFTLTPEEGYGPRIAEALVELPKDVFMVDGKIEDGLLEVGNQIPMSTQDGQSLLGVVKVVGDQTVTMDFNHPMAGETLNFSGKIESVREATDADLMPMGGGCGCGDCGDGSCDDSDSGCGCGCN